MLVDETLTLGKSLLELGFGGTELLDAVDLLLLLALLLILFALALLVASLSCLLNTSLPIPDLLLDSVVLSSSLLMQGIINGIKTLGIFVTKLGNKSLRV